MRFNTKELAYYASTRFGKADKEGALWMKEYEGILKRKESELGISVHVVVRRVSASLLPSQRTHRGGFYSQEIFCSTVGQSIQ